MSSFSNGGPHGEVGFAGGIRAVALAAVLALGGVAASGQELKGLMSELLATHPRLEASRNDVRSAESKISDTFRRAWTPNFDITAEDGQQRYESLGAGNTASGRDLDYWRANVRANQQLYDFGKTSRQVAEAEAVLGQSKALASSTESGILLEALSAHWSYVRADKVLEYSRQSEQSVRSQAKMESSMVELGKGYESNVLQAKVQLTSAESRSLKAVGALDIARARVKAVFGDAASKVTYKQLAVIKPEALPKSLEEAKHIALANNQQIQVGIYRSQAILERISSTQSKEFFPRLNLVMEKNRRYNTEGVAAADGQSSYPVFSDEKLYLQFQYSFNAGGAGLSAVEAVKHDYDASVGREADTRQLVEEQVNIAWRNVQVAGENRATLSNLVRIAAKFYEMAVAERQIGRRSLLEVLSAELSLINALSDLMSTEADAAIANFTLLQAMGKLDVNSFDLKPVDLVLPKI